MNILTNTPVCLLVRRVATEPTPIRLLADSSGLPFIVSWEEQEEE